LIGYGHISLTQILDSTHPYLTGSFCKLTPSSVSSTRSWKLKKAGHSSMSYMFRVRVLGNLSLFAHSDMIFTHTFRTSGALYLDGRCLRVIIIEYDGRLCCMFMILIHKVELDNSFHVYCTSQDVVELDKAFHMNQ